MVCRWHNIGRNSGIGRQTLSLLICDAAIEILDKFIQVSGARTGNGIECFAKMRILNAGTRQFETLTLVIVIERIYLPGNVSVFNCCGSHLRKMLEKS